MTKGFPYFAGRARYANVTRGNIIGDSSGFPKLLFHRDELRLLGVHGMGEPAMELVHAGLRAMRMNATAERLNRACFNFPPPGDLDKYAAYDAVLQKHPPGPSP